MGKNYRFILAGILSLSLFLFGAPESAYGQSTTLIISGQVVDQESNEPIPFAHVRLKGYAYGTVANVDGRFSLTYPVNQDYLLEISTVGYGSKSIPLKGRDPEAQLKVFLTPSQRILSAVVVTPIDRAYELMKKVIEKIPENYPTEIEVLRAFSRATAQKNEEELYYVIENTQRLEKKSYEKANDGGSVELLESQKVEFQNLDSVANRFYGGSHIGHWGDLVAIRAAILNLKKLGNYDLMIVDTLDWNEGQIIELKYRTRDIKKERVSGSVYIHFESLAVVKMIVSHLGSKPEDLLAGLKGSLGGLIRTNYGYEVDYQYSGSKWRLSNIQYTTAFEKKGEMDIELFDELVVTGMDSVKSIGYNDRIDYRDILLDEVEPYDPNYWEGSNTILVSDDLKKSIEKNVVREVNDERGSMTFYEKMQRFSFQYGLEVFNTDFSETDIAFSDRNIFSSSSSYDQIVFSSIIGYQFNKKFRVGYFSSFSFRQKQYEARGILASYDFDLNPNGRSVYLSPSILLASQTFRQEIGEVERVDYIGGDLDASKSDLYLQAREITARPGLSLSVEKSKRFRFYIQVGYNIELSAVSGLYFNEQQSFWKRSSAFVKNGEGGLTMDYEDPLLQNCWQFGTGVVWFLR